MLRHPSNWLGIFAVTFGAAACKAPPARQAVSGKAPATTEAGGPSPSRLYASRTLHKPPPLTGSGEAARRNVLSFIDWAGMSTVEEREDARKVITGARDNGDVAKVLCDEAFQAQKTDHSRALLVLAILGEMRSSVGAECLERFMRLPFPDSGTVVDGEIVEQTALGTLQAKAIAGLAYMRTARGDEAVLRAVAKHPSRIVRAEAMNAYLWNHGDTPQARATLRRYVRKGEEAFLDRIRREPGDSASVFNRRLDAYLKAHPEAIPPVPEHGKRTEKDTLQDKRSPPAPPPRP